MKKKEFVRIVTGAMEMIENQEDVYSCNALSYLQKDTDTVKRDYSQVFGDDCLIFYCIQLGFGISCSHREERKQVRLNALAMYLAQSLAFKTYKGL